MKRSRGFLAALLLLAVVGGCTKYQTVRVPPAIDLKQHEMIGVVEFEVTNKGKLGPLTTRRFTESARRDQGIVRMVPVGNRGFQRDPEAIRELGERHAVRTILVGRLEISDVRPNVQVSTLLRGGSLTALVDATLAVEMIETSTGASIWSTSARATKSLGNITVWGKKHFVFDAEDPERAYGVLVDALVEQVTRDFHAGWERYPVR